MLFYYSGTGNTQKAAQFVANRLEDKCIDIEAAIAENQYQYQLGDNERLGFAIPVYFGSVPAIVQDFISKLKIQTGEHYYCYLLMTDGGMAFKTGDQFSFLLVKSGLTLNAIFEIVTYDSSCIAWKNETIDWDKLKHAVETQTAFVAEQIFDRTTGNHYKQQILSGLATASMKLIYRAIQTSHFRVSDKCTGCGLCAKKCPTHSIEMSEDHPKWINAHCMLCMRCLHHCPAEAIDIFGSPGRPRYKKAV